MSVKKGCILLGAALCIAVIVGSASFAWAADDSMRGKTFRLAINATFRPFESATPDGGFEGLDIDILNHIADTLGFKVEFHDMDFSGLVGALSSGRADFVISGISPTEERLKFLDASISYFYPTIAIVSRKSKPYSTPEALKGLKVAVPFGTTYEAQAQKFEGVEVVPINDTTAVVQELLNERVDAAVLDGCQSAEFAKLHPGQIEFRLLPVEMDRENSYAILFPKDSPYVAPMNAVLEEMLKNGEVDRIIEKWLGADYLDNYKKGLQSAIGN